MTLGKVWRGVAWQFKQAGLDSPDLDARLLTGFAFELDDLQLVVRENDSVSAQKLAKINELAARRVAGEPVARIIGSKEFYGLEFALNPDTLVPRPETEMLVDIGLAHLADRSTRNCLDLGTGTGCIPISLLANNEHLLAMAVDISSGALAQAKINAVVHGVQERVSFFCGAWFAPLPPNSRFDLITANPPYIQRAALNDLASEVRLFDPNLALDGGPDGLAAYREIVQSARDYLNPGGLLALEIGYDQAIAVGDICQSVGLEKIDIKYDLAGHPRVIIAS